MEDIRGDGCGKGKWWWSLGGGEGGGLLASYSPASQSPVDQHSIEHGTGVIVAVS